MQNFQDTFEACKQSFISAFSICMTVPLLTFSVFKYGRKVYSLLFFHDMQKQTQINYST